MPTNTHPPELSDACAARWHNATSALLVIALILAILTAGHYGDSWDEKIRSDAGEQKLAYYEALFSSNFGAAREIAARKDNYPGFHDLSLALLKRISPLDDFLTGNLFGAALGWLTVLGCVFLANRIAGPPAGFFAALLLLLFPGFYGHIFINPKDIPFAFGSIWALYYIHQWVTGSEDTPDWRVTYWTGLFCGITMACRIGGLLMLCYLALFVGIVMLWRRRFSDIPHLIAAGAIAFTVLLVFWPHAHSNPFASTSETLGTVTHFDWEMPVFFEGQFINAAGLPWYYLPKLFLLTTPLPFLLALGVGMAVIGRHAVRAVQRQSKLPPEQLLGMLLVAFATGFPLAYIILRDSVVYNGIRHVLFVLPPAAIIGAYGLERLWSWLRAHRPILFLPVFTVLFLAFTGVGYQMIRLHPYQYIYYNAIAGGTARAAERYETDYWGTAYRELAYRFFQHLRTTRPSFSRPMVVVNMEHVTWLFKPFLPESERLPIVVVRAQQHNADYYAASTLWGADQFHPGEVVVQVKRAGIPLAVIKDCRAESNSEP